MQKFRMWTCSDAAVQLTLNTPLITAAKISLVCGRVAYIVLFFCLLFAVMRVTGLNGAYLCRSLLATSTSFTRSKACSLFVNGSSAHGLHKLWMARCDFYRCHTLWQHETFLYGAHCCCLGPIVILESTCAHMYMWHCYLRLQLIWIMFDVNRCLQ